MAVRLNRSGFDRAQDLLEAGSMVRDNGAEWDAHRPAPEEEDRFIREHGIGEYGRWHLAFDDGEPEGSKRRYLFLFGDFRDVHRCAVLDARSRASSHPVIEAAAEVLLRSLDALV